MTSSVNTVGSIDWVPSVYFADRLVKCDLAEAWNALWDYRVWNPTFVGAQVNTVEGRERTEGELVLITKDVADVSGEPFPAFYCRTVKVVPRRRIVWYAYAKDGQPYEGQYDPFRNFIDFGLIDESGAVRFTINYFAQNRLSGGPLDFERGLMLAGLPEIAEAFGTHCEMKRKR